MTNRTPEEIARGLTEAQRRAVREQGYEPGKIPSCTTAACRCALQKLGLVVDRQYEETLTPLGLAVRSHLESHKP